MEQQLKSQFAINDKLENPFHHITFSESSEIEDLALEEIFEAGKVIVIDNWVPKELDFFFEARGIVFDEWRPPIYSSRILKEANDKNDLWDYYPDKSFIELFQKNIIKFQNIYEDFLRGIFPSYEFEKLMFSWRMNELSLGNLHFDIPESSFSEHQIRLFVNLSKRPRVIEFGPTFEQIVKKFLKEDNLSDYFNLDYDKFLEVVKAKTIQARKFEDHILPRHFLSLAPGSIWISNAFNILHGVVFGEKTVCLEGRIFEVSLKNPLSCFKNKYSEIRKKPQSDKIQDIFLYE